MTNQATAVPRILPRTSIHLYPKRFTLQFKPAFGEWTDGGDYDDLDNAEQAARPHMARIHDVRIIDNRA